MITEVKKLSDDRYQLNDLIILSNINMDDDGITYTMEYDDGVINEDQAGKIVDIFIKEAIDSYKED